MNKLENIDHIAIQVKDIKKSVKWYTDNYSCKVIYSDDTWGFLQFENIVLKNTQMIPMYIYTY